MILICFRNKSSLESTCVLLFTSARLQVTIDPFNSITTRHPSIFRLLNNLSDPSL